MKKTSQQWWAEVKADPDKLNGWLIRQYRGEATASRRIKEFADRYAPDTVTKRILGMIADQEKQHAEWVLELLKARGIEPNLNDAEKRYWKETLPDIKTFSTGAAVGAHAERMRLERIETIANDRGAPQDIRKTFQLILKDELFHAAAFEQMAGPEALEQTLPSHRRGREALGLEP